MKKALAIILMFGVFLALLGCDGSDVEPVDNGTQSEIVEAPSEAREPISVTVDDELAGFIGEVIRDGETVTFPISAGTWKITVSNYTVVSFFDSDGVTQKYQLMMKSPSSNTATLVTEGVVSLDDGDIFVMRTVDGSSLVTFTPVDDDYISNQTPESEPIPEPEPEPEPLLVHEDNYVTISFIGTDTDNRNRERLVFRVDNKTDVELTFQSSSMSIDGTSLGRISGSDSVAAQSNGFVRFRADEDFPTLTPSTISGTMRVIDFGRTLLERSYDVSFTNLEVQ